jgi:O-antigen/teichoic acid export membrane protein
MSPIINTFDDDILVTIYGLQYDGYGYILKYYIVLALISVFLTFIQVYLRVTHSLQNWLFAHTVATMIALIMSYPLISNYNIDGVLYGLILSQIVILTIIIARTTNTQIRVTYNA